MITGAESSWKLFENRDLGGRFARAKRGRVVEHEVKKPIGDPIDFLVDFCAKIAISGAHFDFQFGRFRRLLRGLNLFEFCAKFANSALIARFHVGRFLGEICNFGALFESQVLLSVFVFLE